MKYARFDIEALAEEYGANNLRFFIPMQKIHGLHHLGLPIGITSSSDPEVIQECVVDERRYKLADGYKIELRAIAGQDDPQNYFGSKTFYQSDLESIMARNFDTHRVFVLVDAEDNFRCFNYQQLGLDVIAYEKHENIRREAAKKQVD